MPIEIVEILVFVGGQSTIFSYGEIKLSIHLNYSDIFDLSNYLKWILTIANKQPLCSDIS